MWRQRYLSDENNMTPMENTDINLNTQSERFLQWKQTGAQNTTFKTFYLNKS